MTDTKEKILETALKLFAKDGYEAVSVSDIADELGITKGALYKHYRNKRDIFDSILARMEQNDAEKANEHDLPEETISESEDKYKTASLNDMVEFAKSMFRYWTQNNFASQFRKMLTLEQFRSEEMKNLYQQYLGSGPLDYMTDLFNSAGLSHPREKATEFYSPMFLLYSIYDGAQDKNSVLELLDSCLELSKQNLNKEKNMENNISFRNETQNDYSAVENLVRESFWNVYRPGCTEHYVLHKLRSDPAFVKELDFVMEKDGKLIGQNIFMRAHIKSDDGKEIPILAMGPICITPELKRKGYGKRLLDWSLDQAKALGYGALCFEGNIDFYGKSGFTYASSFKIRYHGLPEDADSSFFLCKELIPGYLNGITGEYAPPEGYYAAEQNPEEFESFDSKFPPKEKQKLPGQLF